MKKIFSISLLLSLFAVLQVGLLAADKEDRQREKEDSGYLKHVFPTALSFGIDPLPVDRMMLVTKAPKFLQLPTPPSLPGVSVLDGNKTVSTDPSVGPTETIDPPASLLADPALAVPAPSLILSPSRFQRPVLGSSTIVTSDEVLQLLELGGASTLNSKQRIIVPFEMPFSQTPSAAVLSSKARYIKRIK